MTTYRDLARLAYIDKFAAICDMEDRTAYPNAFFEAPDPEDDVLWARLIVEESDRRKVELGPRPGARSRVFGSVVVQLFAPVGRGTEQLYELQSALEEAFDSKTVNGLVFATPSSRELGRSGDWYQTTVSCPFHYDELG